MELSEHRKFIINRKLMELIKLVPSDDAECIGHLLTKYQIDAKSEIGKVDKKLCPTCGEYKDKAEFGYLPNYKDYPNCWDCRTIAAIKGNIRYEIREINNKHNLHVHELLRIISDKYTCKGCWYGHKSIQPACGTNKCPHYELFKICDEIDYSDHEIQRDQDYFTEKALSEQSEIINMILFYKQIRKKMSNLKKEQK